jgi:hypothetical protein
MPVCLLVCAWQYFFNMDLRNDYLLFSKGVHVNGMHVNPLDRFLEHISIPVAVAVFAAQYELDGWIEELECCIMISTFWPWH